MINQAVLLLKNKKYLSHFVRILYKHNFKKIFIFTNKKIKIDNFKTFFDKIEFSFTQDLDPLITNKYKQVYNKLDEEFISINCDFFLAEDYFFLKRYFYNKKNSIYIKSIGKHIPFALFKKKIFLSKSNSKKIFKLKKNIKKKFNFLTLQYSKKNIIKLFFANIYQKTIILDRDGVINVNKGYVGFKNKFFFQKGAIKALKYLSEEKYNIYVITNQSGIARGYFLEKDVISLHNYIRDKLETKNVPINKIYYSPYHKDGIINKFKKNSSCRKPGIKLFKILCEEWNVNDKKNIMMIGDQISDIEFAKNAKIKSALFKDGNLFNFIKDLKNKKKF